MSIWYNKSLKITDLGAIEPGTMAEFLGMEWTEIGDDYVKIKMPVDQRTKQPYGLLHGGASCALAETIGSVASQVHTLNEKRTTINEKQEKVSLKRLLQNSQRQPADTNKLFLIIINFYIPHMCSTTQMQRFCNTRNKTTSCTTDMVGIYFQSNTNKFIGVKH